MARKTVKIEIPINNDDEMIKLAEAILKRNSQPAPPAPPAPPAAAAAVDTPLVKYDMKDFGEKTTTGKARKTKSREYDKLSQGENEQAKKLIGSLDGQTVNTKGTIYNYVTRMRDTLLDFYEDDAEQLGQWGYKVVTGEAKSPKRKPKA